MAYSRDVVGIDVSKDRLDIFVLTQQESRSVPNTADGCAVLVGSLKALGVRLAVMEASGGYEREVGRVLREAGFEVRIVDPKRVRHFARAAGRLAKNDRIDARMIAEFGGIFALARSYEVPADAEREQLAALLTARQALIEHQTGLSNQVRAAPAGAARRALAATLEPIAAAIKEMDRAMAAVIVAHPPFAALAARLRTVPGLGPVVTAAFIAWLPELGRLDRRALAALVGVAPFDDDSGRRSGQRYIKGGRCKLRNLLYMATMAAATRYNPVLKAHYAAMIERGKPPKVALVACMRKLLTILNTMVARQKDWAPTPALAA